MMQSKDMAYIGLGSCRVPHITKHALQAAVELGLSENQAGKLFGVPSASRILKELRNVQHLNRLSLQLMSEDERIA